jgi:hypothetical protein
MHRYAALMLCSLSVASMAPAQSSSQALTVEALASQTHTSLGY